MMIARRALLGGLAALPLVNHAAAWQAAPGGFHTRIIPGANQAVPVIGVGTAVLWQVVRYSSSMSSTRVPSSYVRTAAML